MANGVSGWILVGCVALAACSNEEHGHLYPTEQGTGLVNAGGNFSGFEPSESGGGCSAPVADFEGVLATRPQSGSYAVFRNLYVDCDVVLWDNGQTVISVDIATGATRALYSGPRCGQGLAFDDDELYFGACSQLESEPNGLQAVSRATQEQRSLNTLLTFDVARVGSDLFTVGCSASVTRIAAQGTFSFDIPGASCLSSILVAGSGLIPSDAEAWHVDLVSGAVFGLGRVQPLSADAEHVVVTRDLPKDGSKALEVIALADRSSRKLLVKTESGGFSGAVLAGSTVYYSWRHPVPGGTPDMVGEIGSVPLAGGESSVIATGSYVGAVAADDVAIYWEDELLQSPTLHRMLR